MVPRATGVLRNKLLDRDWTIGTKVKKADYSNSSKLELLNESFFFCLSIEIMFVFL